MDIKKILTHVCDLLRPEASTRRIEIVAELPPDLPLVTADSVRLTQALMNLVVDILYACFDPRIRYGNAA